MTLQTISEKVRSSADGVSRVLAKNPNALTFAVGLAVLAASVSQWSAPAAGVIVGVTLMLVAVWPFVARARQER